MLVSLLEDVRACRACANVLPLGPRPIVQISATARILIASQAPGIKAHQSGIPFSDASGDRLREWMGVPNDTFYDEQRISILPMGLCHPGRLLGVVTRRRVPNERRSGVTGWWRTCPPCG